MSRKKSRKNRRNEKWLGSCEIRQQIADEMMYRVAKSMPQEYRGAYEKAPEGMGTFTETIKQ